MNTFLQSSAGRYPKDLESTLIHPLSHTDAEIVTELTSLLKDAGMHEVVSILNQWKYLKDKEIYDKLLDIHTKFIIERDDETEDSIDGVPQVKDKKSKNDLGLLFRRNWIYFRHYRMDVHYVRDYEKRDEYVFAKHTMMYFIIINALPETTSVTNAETNKTLEYADMEQRDADFALLDNYISSFPGVNFINERND